MGKYKIDARNYLANDFEKELFQERALLILEHGLSEAEASMVVVSKLSDDELISLSVPFKADLVDALAESEDSIPNPDKNIIISSKQRADYEARGIDIALHTDFEDIGKNFLGYENYTISADDVLARVYKHTKVSQEGSAFDQWEDKNRLALFKSLATDPVLADARANWKDMGIEQRLETIKHVHVLHIQSLDTKFSISASDISHADLGEYDHGSFVFSNQNIKIHTDLLQNGSFSDVLDIILHEGVHAIDYQLKKELENGRIDESHPMYFDISIIARNYDDYHSHQSEGIERYMENVIEQRARLSQNASLFTGIFDLENGTVYPDVTEDQAFDTQSVLMANFGHINDPEILHIVKSLGEITGVFLGASPTPEPLPNTNQLVPEYRP